MKLRTSAAVAMAGLVAVAGLSAAGPLPAPYSETQDFPVNGAVRVLDVAGNATSVTVVPGAVPSVTAYLSWYTERPVVTVALTDGVLTVRASCDDRIGAGGASISFSGFCTADVDVVVPSTTAVRASIGSGSLSVSGLTGNQDLRASYGDLSLTRIEAASVRARSGNGSVVATDVQAPKLSLESGYGDVSASDVRARDALMQSSNGSVSLVDSEVSASATVSSSYGDVSVSQVAAPALTLRSSNGQVSAADLQVSALRATSAYGDVDINRLQGRSLSATTSNGSVSLVDSAVAASATVTSSYGDVVVSDVTGASLLARSSNGSVRLSGLDVAQVSAGSTYGDVSAALTSVPDLLRVSSGNGDVEATVPAGAYRVDAVATDGEVELDGVTHDPSAAPRIVARADYGDVRLTGV